MYNVYVKKETEIKLRKLLTGREFDFMDYRFGLMDGCPHALKDCAQHFSVSHERVEHILINAIEKIKYHHPDILDEISFP